MAKKQRDKDKNPPNCYLVGDSWVIEFVFHGERFRESIGKVSKTIAGEMADTRRSKCGLGELVVNGKRWDRYGKQWITETSVSKLEDPLFEKAMKTYLEWYQANRRPYTYARYAVPASKAL